MAYVDAYKTQILGIIDKWNGKLTWDLLGRELQDQLGLATPPSRHALLGYDDIKNAFLLKKERFREKKVEMLQKAKDLSKDPSDLSDLLSDLNDDDATIRALIERAKKLENENQSLDAKAKRLESEKAILIEQFVRWQKNLSQMNGVDMSKLVASIDDPLPGKNVR